MVGKQFFTISLTNAIDEYFMSCLILVFWYLETLNGQNRQASRTRQSHSNTARENWRSSIVSGSGTESQRHLCWLMSFLFCEIYALTTILGRRVAKPCHVMPKNNSSSAHNHIVVLASTTVAVAPSTTLKDLCLRHRYDVDGNGVELCIFP